MGRLSVVVFVCVMVMCEHEGLCVLVQLEFVEDYMPDPSKGASSSGGDAPPAAPQDI